MRNTILPKDLSSLRSTVWGSVPLRNTILPKDNHVLSVKYISSVPLRNTILPKGQTRAFRVRTHDANDHVTSDSGR